MHPPQEAQAGRGTRDEAGDGQDNRFRGKRTTKKTRLGGLLRDGDSGGLLRDVDTVKELADVLVADEGLAVDVGGRLRDHLDVVALEDELVLLGLGLGDGDALEELDVTDTLLAEEVAGGWRRERGKGGKRKKRTESEVSTRTDRLVSPEKRGENERKEATHRISTDFLSPAMITLMGK